MVKFVGEVWRCQAMKTFVNQNRQLVIYPPWNFQQCNWRRSGVMWSHFDDVKTSRAAAFITHCKCRARLMECQPTLHFNSPIRSFVYTFNVIQYFTQSRIVLDWLCLTLLKHRLRINQVHANTTDDLETYSKLLTATLNWSTGEHWKY